MTADQEKKKKQEEEENLAYWLAWIKKQNNKTWKSFTLSFQAEQSSLVWFAAEREFTINKLYYPWKRTKHVPVVRLESDF